MDPQIHDFYDSSMIRYAMVNVMGHDWESMVHGRQAMQLKARESVKMGVETVKNNPVKDFYIYRLKQRKLEA